MDSDNIIYGPNREYNEKMRDKIIKACPPKHKKVFANGVFEISVPVKKEDIPVNELKFLEEQSKRK